MRQITKRTEVSGEILIKEKKFHSSKVGDNSKYISYMPDNREVIGVGKEDQEEFGQNLHPGLDYSKFNALDSPWYIEEEY